MSFSNSLTIHLVNTKEIRTVTVVWKSDLNLHRFLRFYFSIFSIILVSIEKIYQTLVKVFHHMSKHLKVRQKYFDHFDHFDAGVLYIPAVGVSQVAARLQVSRS